MPEGTIDCRAKGRDDQDMDTDPRSSGLNPQARDFQNLMDELNYFMRTHRFQRPTKHVAAGKRTRSQMEPIPKSRHLISALQYKNESIPMLY